MRSRASGYAYLYLLFTIALLAIAVTGVSTLDMLARRHAEERELIRIGHEFRAALLSYRRNGPARQFPVELEELLEDRRGGSLRRHLRRFYVDPISKQAEWGLIRQGGQIIGVHSLSEREPMKVANFEPEDAGFENAKTFQDWTFLVIEVDPLLTPGGSRLPGALPDAPALPSNGLSGSR